MDQGLSECNSSWAIETEDSVSSEILQNEERAAADFSSSCTPSRKKEGSSPSKKDRHAKSLDKRDLRHKLSGDRYADDNSENSHRPNYLRGKDGLSPLRSPLTAEQSSFGSRRSNGRRRGLGREERRSRQGITTNQSLSPRKHANQYTASSPSRSSKDDSDESRRRLNLPAEKESDSEEVESLNPDNDEDQIVLARREKQIAYGKCTESYQQYIATVPREERCGNRKKHPRTPIKHHKCSRRNWDAQIKAWKKFLHEWAKEEEAGEDVALDCSPLCPALTEEAGSSTSAKEKAEIEDSSNKVNGDEDDFDSDDSFLEGFDLEVS